MAKRRDPAAHAEAANDEKSAAGSTPRRQHR